MVRIKEILKSVDVFGYRVGLNFNNSGNTHKTIPGAIVSLLVYIGVFAYCALLINRIDNREYDTLTTVTKPANAETFKRTSLDQMDLDILTHLYYGKWQDVIIYNDTIKEYITVQYE